MNASPRPRALPFSSLSASALVACALALAGCGSGHGHTVVLTNPVIHETEPNDTAFQPDGIGPVHAGTYYQIVGAVDAPGSYGLDEFDGFAFFVQQPVEIEFVLHAANPFADLDVWIYDPYFDEYIARFESASSPEYGVVTFPYVGEEFHVVVSSFSGDSDYTLEVVAHPLYGGFASAASGSGDAPEAGTDSEKPLRRMDGYLKRTGREPLALSTITVLSPESGEVRRYEALLAGPRD